MPDTTHIIYLPLSLEKKELSTNSNLSLRGCIEYDNDETLPLGISGLSSDAVR